nr:hypothetical protein [Ardenticatena sp.]
MPEHEPLFVVQDPEIDVDAIMQTIRQRIAERRARLGKPHRHFPSFDETGMPEEPHDLPHDANLYHHLRLLNELYFAFPLEPVLASSRTTQLPLVGKIWARLRREAHNLVLFYVSRIIGHQIQLNRHIVGVLNRLVAENIALRRQIRELETRLADAPPDEPS